jgi:hypothetical protein
MVYMEMVYMLVTMQKKAGEEPNRWRLWFRKLKSDVAAVPNGLLKKQYEKLGYYDLSFKIASDTEFLCVILQT